MYRYRLRLLNAKRRKTWNAEDKWSEREAKREKEKSRTKEIVSFNTIIRR
jgi:hypothetical protein